MPLRSRCRSLDLVLPSFLFLLTFLTFRPALRNTFVFDDIQYITANEHLRSGLSWEGIHWAFTTSYASNWHPLTWLSHMLDVEFFGLDPRGHHLVNLILHAANAGLLLYLLRQATGARWRSFFAAALFAVHPLRVESVAWAAERKDVLSALFGLLAVTFYLRGQRQAARRLPIPTALFFVMSLLAKPTFITLPFLLLLLDYWPLGRHLGTHPTRVWFRLLGEKGFLLVIALLSAIRTVVAADNAIIGLQHNPFSARVLNSFHAISSYLGHTFWPARLAVFYPVQPQTTVWASTAAISLFVAVSAAAFLFRRRLPYLAVGGSWFLIALLPVIGLVQVGTHASADRYTYLPSVGLMPALAWLCADLGGGGRKRWIIVTIGAAAVAALVPVTLRQVHVWKNNTTLFQSALTATDKNYLAHYNLAVALNQPQTAAEALVHLREAVRLRPSFTPAQIALARGLAGRDHLGEAIFHLRQVLHFEPENAEVHRELGEILLRRHDHRAAEEHLQRALRINPTSDKVRETLRVLRAEQEQR